MSLSVAGSSASVARATTGPEGLFRLESLKPGRAYGSYDALLNDPEVEMVFITTHNGLHCELAIEAMRRGKHVLCEKPLAPSVAECARMVAESKRSGRRLMEAFMYRYHPQIAALRQVALSGRIGKMEHVSAAFHFHLSRTDDVRLVPAFGGGALLDVGCYGVNISRLLLGERVTEVSATATRTKPGGVDIEGHAALAFESGATAAISFGFVGQMRQEVVVRGTEGEASLNWAFAYRGEPQVLEVRIGGAIERVEFGQTDTYQLEVEDFAGAIIGGRDPLLAPDEGLKNAMVLERIGAAS